MSKTQLFFASLVLTAGALLVMFYIDHVKSSALNLVRVDDGVFITSQLKTQQIRALKEQEIRTVIDIRPDGEAPDQVPSSRIEVAAKINGLNFHYIPVPQENIPNAAVQELNEALSHDGTPAVLYCRTGRRAVRTFALAKASQVDGPSIGTILEMARAAGFPSEDLRANIADRIARRNSPQTLKP